jgi:hypothetical protein
MFKVNGIAGRSVNVQGGSDISGTLSKLHRCIKKSYFFY